MILHKKLILFALLFLLILTSISYSQTKDTAFQSRWAEIDTLIISKNLSKTALAKVNELYLEASKANNTVQQIKALVYRLTLEEKVNEADANRNAKTLKEKIAGTRDITAKSILYILLAKHYQSYFYTHRWSFYGRSQTTGYIKDDINTWNSDDFQKAITENYLFALKAPDILQQTTLEPFNVIILKGNARQLRPTLYDLLAHEALDYFKTGEAYITKPAYAFVLDDKRALAKLNDFQSERFTSKDSGSHLLICLQLFQQLISFHQIDTDPAALIDVNMERIRWVYENTAFEEKENLYRDALREITLAFKNNTASSEAFYWLARKEADQAQTYAPFGDTAHRYDYIKALQIIDEGLQNYKEINRGTALLKGLAQEIKQKGIRLETEKVNLPGKPFRTLVTYKNIDTLYGRIIPVNSKDSLRDNLYNSNMWKDVVKHPFVKTFTQKLPATNDYQEHGVEIKIDALPVGEYAVLVSGSKQFNSSTDKLAMQFFYVSGISYIKNNNDCFVLNRETGKPIGNASVTVLQKTYNSKRELQSKKMAPVYTDKNGHTTIKTNKNDYRTSFEFIIETKNDHLQLPENVYTPYRMRERTPATDLNFEKLNASVFYFTDRSIYRPGQKVFFKGIAVTKEEKTGLSKLYLQKDSLLVYLKDVNSKIIDSVRCKQNEFGSFANSFMIPQNVLTGQFTIQTKTILNGEASFNIEEYKRPRFYVSFDKVKEAYQLNDSITITGYAKAFSGNTIDGANVKFNIKRSTRFIYSWLMPNSKRMPGNNAEITHGEISTDVNGKFSFKFKAVPDLAVDKKTDPVFDFSIVAEVTDANGETRNANTIINTGYKSLLLHIDAPEIAECDSARKQITVIAKNRSGEKENVTVKVKIYSLQSPQRLIRERLWSRADQFVITKESYIQYFPNDDYDDETNSQNWPVKQIVSENTISTKETNQLLKDNIKLKPGYYKIEVTTTDINNQLVKDVRTIQLFNGSQPPAITTNFSYTRNNIAEPGVKTIFLAGSSADSTYIIRQTIHPGKQTNASFEYIKRNKGLHSIVYSPKETDRGGVFMEEIFVRNSRVYTNIYHITVPWTNKELQVNYKTYRDKTEPGSKEKWTVTINGKKGDKAATELVTTLYDASLDQFVQNDWTIPDIWPITNHFSSWNYSACFSDVYSSANEIEELNYYKEKTYDQLAIVAPIFNTGFEEGVADSVRIADDYSGTNSQNVSLAVPIASNKVMGVQLGRGELTQFKMKVQPGHNAEPVATKGTSDVAGASPFYVRKNFNETAFFFPQLQADSTGNYSFTFTIPEALTQWKWMSFAHTKELAMGINSTLVTTQKTLMVQPNAPRFMREGDHMEFTAKIANLSNKELTGQVTLELTDAITNTSVDGWFQNVFPVQYFTVAANQSSTVRFPIQIPFSYNKPLTYRVVAKAGDYSDGEENILPVLTNRILVTESLPLLLNSDTTQHFVLEKLLHHTSETLTNESLTVEYTSNPVWAAVQALPYLMEYPYECAEQTFNRLYANVLAANIVNKHPLIKSVFEQWKKDTTALISNLQKNEELKQVLLQETPWVLQAENETQQKKNISLLFDVVKMATSSDASIEKLKQMQLPDGSFCWFKGGNADRYITNYILTGIGKLKKAGMLSAEMNDKLGGIITNAFHYLDDQFTADYRDLIKNNTDLSKEHITTTQVQYLYMRSFFMQDTVANMAAFQYYYKQAKQFWNKQNLYNQAMLGLVFYRNQDQVITINSIIPSVTENAIDAAEKGMYWKETYTYTSFWYQSPIEYQSLMIALVNEVNESQKNVLLTKELNDMRTWLLLNKQTNNWRTTVATADACYALLAENNLLNTNQQARFQLGTTTIGSQTEKAEAGTGYFKKRLEGRSVNPEMGNITITTQSDPRPANNSSTISFGNIYWSYFEDLDKITEASSPLSLHKKLLVEKNTDNGRTLTLLKDGSELKTGDKVIVRIELKSDRDMDYLHLKDKRAACMEPVNVLSGYKWQDGLGYYEATKDASTNFFIGHLPKGTYVFEYPLYITHTGTFSVGIATIQSMYAPEFTSHSEGIKVNVGQQP